MSQKRVCLECGEPLVGRVDKKFCSDYCRNAYNNRKSRETDRLIRDTNKKLKINWKILMELNTENPTKIHRETMLKKGFDFNLITEIYRTKKGDLYYYVYDQGYLKINENFYLLVKKLEK